MADVQTGRITVRCSCGAKLATPLAAAGKTIKCPKCRDTLPIPGLTPISSGASHVSAHSHAPTPPPDASSAERIAVRCDSCGAKMSVPASAAGRKGKCPKCGTAFVVGDPAATRLEAPEPAKTPETPHAAEEPEEESLIDDLARQEQAANVITQASAPASQGQRPCPACGVMMAAEASLCVSCGYNVQTGRVHKAAGGLGALSRLVPKAGLGILSRLAAVAGPFILGCVLCTVGATIGAIIWSLIAIKTGYEIGWIAWVVGVLAGIGMHIGFRDEGALAGGVAAGMSALSILAAKVAIFSYLVYAVVTGNSNDIQIQRAHVTAIMTEQILDDRGAVSESQRKAQQEAAAKEAEKRVAKMNDREVRQRARQSRETQAKQEQFARSLVQARLASHRAELIADQKGLSPWDETRAKLHETETNKCKAMSEADLDKAVKELEAWEAGGKWSDAEYCRNYLIYADIRKTIKARSPNAQAKDEEDEDEEEKPAVTPQEWKKLHAAAVAKIDAIPREQRMRQAKEADAEQQKRLEQAIAKAGAESEQARADAKAAAGELLGIFARAMFRPLDILFFLLAIGTAYRIAGHGLTYGESS